MFYHSANYNDFWAHGSVDEEDLHETNEAHVESENISHPRPFKAFFCLQDPA